MTNLERSMKMPMHIPSDPTNPIVRPSFIFCYYSVTIALFCNTVITKDWKSKCTLIVVWLNKYDGP